MDDEHLPTTTPHMFPSLLAGLPQRWRKKSSAWPPHANWASVTHTSLGRLWCTRYRESEDSKKSINVVSHPAETSKRRSKAKAGQSTVPLTLGPHADLVVNFGGSKSSQTRKTTTKPKTVRGEGGIGQVGLCR